MAAVEEVTKTMTGKVKNIAGSRDGEKGKLGGEE